MTESDYTPIDCGFHDRLEAHAVRRTVVSVVFADEQDRPITIEAHIDDVFARDGADWVLLRPADGTSTRTVRLDRLVSVDGVSVPLSC